jgi:hypothetical protein
MPHIKASLGKMGFSKSYDNNLILQQFPSSAVERKLSPSFALPEWGLLGVLT